MLLWPGGIKGSVQVLGGCGGKEMYWGGDEKQVRLVAQISVGL